MSAVTREQAARRIVEIRDDPAYWHQWPNPEKHELLFRELLEMQRIAMEPVEISEEERAARAKSQAESEAARKAIAELKADPAYWDDRTNPAKHAELIAKVNEIGAVAYRGSE